MAKNNSREKFWTILITINLLGILYPMGSLFHADSIDQRIVAAVIVGGVLFLLGIIDAIAITLSYLE